LGSAEEGHADPSVASAGVCRCSGASAALALGDLSPSGVDAALLGEHPIMQRGADIADMQAAGRRRCETGSGHARPYRRPTLE